MIWIVFLLLLGTLLAIDLRGFHRQPREVGTKEALVWSGIWIVVAIAFAGFVYLAYEHAWLDLGTQIDRVDGTLNDGSAAAAKYLTGYVIEKSLSSDNLFVIAALFSALAIPRVHQHRVLVWGILGAVMLRGVLIGLGSELVQHYRWVLYLFGGALIAMAARMLAGGSAQRETGDAWTLRLARRVLPVTPQFHGKRFLARVRGRWMLTPLALAVVAVESTDVIFAVDSVPAVFAITADPFLVFTSNIFALLSLRSLYFALAGLIARFKRLKPALAAILVMIGTKMLAGHWMEHAVGPSLDLWMLAAVLAILAIGVIASLKSTPLRGEDATVSLESKGNHR